MNKYHDFKIGDKVKIVRRVEYYIIWVGRVEYYKIRGGTWNKDGKMDWTLGETGEITRIIGEILRVRFVNDEIWNYHYECLEKVEEGGISPSVEKETDIEKELKVGDEVLIVQKTENSGWMNRMNNTIGLIGKVIKISENNPKFLVEFNKSKHTDTWFYARESLKKVYDVNDFYINYMEVYSDILSEKDLKFLAKENLKFNKLKEENMGDTKTLNLYSVFVVNTKTNEILISDRTIVGSCEKEIECSISDELIRKHEKEKISSYDLAIKVVKLMSWISEKK